MPTANPDTCFKFSEATVRKISDPKAGEKIRYRDAGCPGLAIRASGSARTWVWYGKAKGRPVEVRLGAWPALTVEAARQKAKSEVAPDPAAAQAAKRAELDAQTLKEAWDVLVAHPWRRDGRSKLRPATLRTYKAAWGHLEPHLGARPLVEIDAPTVANVRGKLLKAHGPAQTRRALALLVVLIGGRMPRDGNGRTVGKPNLEPRRRFMDSAELGALLRGLDAEPPLWRVFWLCCLLAPLRRGNIARAKWTDLNLDQPARWIVSGDEAKGGKLLAMPIAEPLAIILRDWKKKNPKAEWVFPAGLTGGPRKGTGSIVSVQHAWARALLFGEAVRLCDAIGPRENMTGKKRFAVFLEDLECERGESWRIARDRKPMVREGTPLDRCISRLRERAKKLKINPVPLALRNLHPHDLRRTAASWAVQGGASMAIVAASLGHADTRVTEAHYGHLSDDPVRRMLADNAGRLLATMPDQTSSPSGETAHIAHEIAETEEGG